MSINAVNVIHQADNHRFCVGETDPVAELSYQMLDANTVNFLRTYVPESQRGKGVAESLVRAGLTWAESAGYQMRTECWYVEKFLA